MMTMSDCIVGKMNTYSCSPRTVEGEGCEGGAQRQYLSEGACCSSCLHIDSLHAKAGEGLEQRYHASLQQKVAPSTSGGGDAQLALQPAAVGSFNAATRCGDLPAPLTTTTALTLLGPGRLCPCGGKGRVVAIHPLQGQAAQPHWRHLDSSCSHQPHWGCRDCTACTTTRNTCEGCRN